jgi:hypothetical protein
VCSLLMPDAGCAGRTSTLFLIILPASSFRRRGFLLAPALFTQTGLLASADHEAGERIAQKGVEASRKQ